MNLTDALHEAADLIAANPTIPAPYITGIDYGDARFSVELKWFLTIGSSADDLAGQKSLATRVIRALGGAWDKEPSVSGDVFNFRQSRGEGIKLLVQVQREAVCERVVTGVKTVTIPAKPAEPERTEELEVVEWRCEPVLAEVSA